MVRLILGQVTESNLLIHSSHNRNHSLGSSHTVPTSFGKSWYVHKHKHIKDRRVQAKGEPLSACHMKLERGTVFCIAVFEKKELS